MSAAERLLEPLLRRRLDTLAADVGRLRRRLDRNSHNAFLVACIAGHIQTLDCVIAPTAGELHRDGVAVDEALGIVEARDQELRALLGEAKA